MIFVFGSNRKGIHGAGSARFARRHYKAVLGVGEGPTGNAYALPTKHTPQRGMTLNEIQEAVSTFLAYAKAHPQDMFKVTQVGCGLGGWTQKDIAPLFAKEAIPSNCYFDVAWNAFLPADTHFWGGF